MAENMAESSRGQKRKKRPVLSEVLERARTILRRDDDTQLPPTSSTATVRKARAPTVYRFSKDSRTGRRITHCQYRPRSSAAASKNVPELDAGMATDVNVSDIDSFSDNGVDVPSSSAETSDALDGETDESPSISRVKRKIGKTCQCCGEEAPIALKKCKRCGDEFPKKEKNWQSIKKLKAPNPTVQRDLLERRADILNHHCDYDIVIVYKRKHLNGVSISSYGTQGLGDAFISGEGEIGMTFKHMFEAFCGEYGKNNAMPHQSSDVASEQIFAPPSEGHHVSNPASPLRVVECGEGNTSQAVSLAGTDTIPCQQKSIETAATSPTLSGSKLAGKTSEDNSRPTVVFYRENGNNVAVGYLHQERDTLHGKSVPRGFYVVQVTWVANQEGGVAAPIILGDAEENRLLSPGKFFALPRAQLARVRVVQGQNVC